MIAIMNGVSFRYSFTTAELAVTKVHQFLDICRRIESAEVTNVREKIRTGVIDMQTEMSPGYKLIQLIQEFKGREERSYLIGLFTNRGTYTEGKESVCSIDGKELSLCSELQDSILISLLSHELFSSPEIQAVKEEEPIELRNISEEKHIDYYRKELGLRRYVPNSTKHKQDKENYYGKGKVASRMDLSHEQAQNLLNRAIEINGRLYAKKNGYYYAFQNERDIDYHGYRADDLREDIKRQLDRAFRE